MGYIHVLSRTQLCATPWTVATRLLCPWDCPGKNTGVDCHFLFQGIFLTQGSKLNLPHLLRLFATESPGKPITNINIGSFYLWDRICVNHFS